MINPMNTKEIYTDHSYDAIVFPHIDNLLNTNVKMEYLFAYEKKEYFLKKLILLLRELKLPLKMQWCFYLVGKLEDGTGCAHHHNKYGFYMRREVYWWNLFLLNFAEDSKKVERDLLAVNGSTNNNEVMNTYCQNVWEIIGKSSDEDLEKLFSHYIPEQNELKMGRGCYCASCQSQKNRTNYLG